MDVDDVVVDVVDVEVVEVDVLEVEDVEDVVVDGAVVLVVDEEVEQLPEEPVPPVACPLAPEPNKATVNPPASENATAARTTRVLVSRLPRPSSERSCPPMVTRASEVPAAEASRPPCVRRAIRSHGQGCVSGLIRKVVRA